ARAPAPGRESTRARNSPVRDGTRRDSGGGDRTGRRRAGYWRYGGADGCTQRRPGGYPPLRGGVAGRWAARSGCVPPAPRSRLLAGRLLLRRLAAITGGCRDEGLPRALQGAQRDHLAVEDQRSGPVQQDPGLAVEARHRPHVVGAVHEPGQRAAELDALDLGHALVQAEGGHRAHVAVLVVLQRLTAHVTHDVVTQVAGLTHRVLGGGPAQRIRFVRGKVRDRGAVPSRPGAVDHGAVL